MELYNAMIETNKHVDIEIEKMNETQKEVFMVFASRIENADFELLEKFKKSISRTLWKNIKLLIYFVMCKNVVCELLEAIGDF